MTDFIWIATTLISIAFIGRLLAFLADSIATLVAVYYGLRMARLSRALLGTKGKNEEVHHDFLSSRAERRLLRRHLTMTMAMTSPSRGSLSKGRLASLRIRV